MRAVREREHLIVPKWHKPGGGNRGSAGQRGPQACDTLARACRRPWRPCGGLRVSNKGRGRARRRESRLGDGGSRRSGGCVGGVPGGCRAAAGWCRVVGTAARSGVRPSSTPVVADAPCVSHLIGGAVCPGRSLPRRPPTDCRTRKPTGSAHPGRATLRRSCSSSGSRSRRPSASRPAPPSETTLSPSCNMRS